MEEVATSLREGIAFFQKGKWENALQAFLNLATDAQANSNDDDEEKELVYYTGLCYTKLKRFKEAQPYLEKFINESRDNLRIYQCRMTLAYVYVMTNKAKMAEYELTRLVNTGFESAQLYVTMAYAAWSQQAYPKAIEWYEKALTIDRENITAMNGLGYVLADSEKDVKRGLRFCKRVVEKKPDNPVYLDSLGWAYYKDGKLVEAKKYLRKALERSPNSQDIKDHLTAVENQLR
jgi:tetratricopeptide (TPR) repeat protein